MKKIQLFVAVCLMLTMNTPLFSQYPMSPEQLWEFSRVSGQAISPDSKTVVFGVKRYSILENKGYNFLYSVPITGGNPVMIADSTEMASTPSWRPDGKKIMYLSSKSGSMQIYQMNPDGTEKKQISFTDTDITNFSFNKAGTQVWYTRDIKASDNYLDQYSDLQKSTARVYDDLMFRHWDHWEDNSFSHVIYIDYDYTLNILNGEFTDIMRYEPYDSPLMPFGDADQISWSPDGKQIAYTCKKLQGTEYATSTNSDVYIYDLETKKTINLTEGMMGYDKNPAFSPDGSKITWLSMETPMYEADRNRLFQYDFKTKTKVELTEGFDYTIESYQWSPSGKEIYFQCGINATDQLWSLEFASKGKPKIKQITNDMADIISVAIGSDPKNPVFITNVMSISAPAELYKLDIKTGKSTQFTAMNHQLMSTIKMGKVEKRMVKATDGKEILTWVIYPPDFDPSKKYPALLYCQGGPQSTVSQFFSYRWNFQLMAANGYIVVAPNRRGLPSFGTEWNRQISGDWGGQAMADLLSAIDDVSKEPYVNKDKLGAVGASFGGYSVYWLAGNHQKRFKAFIAHCGVFNLESMYGTTEEVFFADFDMGGSYFKMPKPKSYTDFNPIKFVNNWDTPIMVIHNDKDFRVPISQGMEAFTAAKLRGIPARFLSFSDENHWVTKPQNGVMWQRAFFDWLGMYLK